MERTLILKTTGYYNFILEKDKELTFMGKLFKAVKKEGIDNYSLKKYIKTRSNN